MLLRTNQLSWSDQDRQIEMLSGERGSASVPLLIACDLMLKREAMVSVSGRDYRKGFLQEGLNENSIYPFEIEKAWTLAQLCSSEPTRK